jgi:hypothetical protein
MDFDTRQFLGDCTFRAAAFWRLLYQVWKLTDKNCPSAFPIGSIDQRNWNTKCPEHVETLVAMIFEMNTGVSARAAFLTYDEAILADAVLMVVQAFSHMPELLPKLETLLLITKVGSACLGSEFLDQRARSRSEEMVVLARDFHRLSKVIENKYVTVSSNIVHGQLPDQNIYLTFTVLE